MTKIDLDFKGFSVLVDQMILCHSYGNLVCGVTLQSQKFSGSTFYDCHLTDGFEDLFNPSLALIDEAPQQAEPIWSSSKHVSNVERLFFLLGSRRDQYLQAQAPRSDYVVIDVKLRF